MKLVIIAAVAHLMCWHADSFDVDDCPSQCSSCPTKMPEDCEPDSMLVTDGDECGCCDVCLQMSGYGESCDNKTTASGHRRVCKPGLHCGYKYCERSHTPCDSYFTGRPYVWHCDANGLFYPIQCSSYHCWCVDPETGITQPFSKVSWLDGAPPENITCTKIYPLYKALLQVPATSTPNKSVMHKQIPISKINKTRESSRVRHNSLNVITGRIKFITDNRTHRIMSAEVKLQMPREQWSMIEQSIKPKDYNLYLLNNFTQIAQSSEVKKTIIGKVVVTLDSGEPQELVKLMALRPETNTRNSPIVILSGGVFRDSNIQDIPKKEILSPANKLFGNKTSSKYNILHKMSHPSIIGRRHNNKANEVKGKIISLNTGQYVKSTRKPTHASELVRHFGITNKNAEIVYFPNSKGNHKARSKHMIGSKMRDRNKMSSLKRKIIHNKTLRVPKTNTVIHNTNRSDLINITIIKPDKNGAAKVIYVSNFEVPKLRQNISNVVVPMSELIEQTNREESKASNGSKSVASPPKRNNLRNPKPGGPDTNNMNLLNEVSVTKSFTNKNVREENEKPSKANKLNYSTVNIINCDCKECTSIDNVKVKRSSNAEPRICAKKLFMSTTTHQNKKFTRNVNGIETVVKQYVLELKSATTPPDQENKIRSLTDQKKSHVKVLNQTIPTGKENFTKPESSIGKLPLVNSTNHKKSHVKALMKTIPAGQENHLINVTKPERRSIGKLLSVNTTKSIKNQTESVVAVKRNLPILIAVRRDKRNAQLETLTQLVKITKHSASTIQKQIQNTVNTFKKIDKI